MSLFSSKYGPGRHKGRDGQPLRTIIKTYRSDDPIKEFEIDAGIMENHGYDLILQNSSPGRWSGGSFIFAIMGCFFAAIFVHWLLAVALIFGFLMIVKPRSTMTATYQRR